MKIFIVASVIVFLYLDLVDVMSLEEMFGSGWDTISSTWNKIIVAIKRPVRPRRLGSIGKRKTSPTLSTLATSHEIAPVFRIDSTTSMATATRETSGLETYTGRFIPYAGKVHAMPEDEVAIDAVPEIRRIIFSKDIPLVTGIRRNNDVAGERTEIKRITFSKGTATVPGDGRVISFPETATVPGDGRVRLPYLTEPVWKTIEDWRRMQRPHFVKIVRNGNFDDDFEALIGNSEDDLTDEPEDDLSDVPEDERFGVLMFVRKK